MPILIGQKLSSPISMDVYGTHNQAVIQGKKMSSASVHQGSILPVYVAPLGAEKYSASFPALFENLMLSFVR